MDGKFALLGILALVLLFGCTQPSPPATPTPAPDAKGLACTSSGGQVLTGLCCASASDFPNTCLIGACGCAPSSSHAVKTCACGEGKCFDGNACVPSGMELPSATPTPTGMMPGGDADAHGCIGSAGYVWCPVKSKCLRLFEENCTGSSLEPQAREFCGNESVSKVYVCGEYVRVVSALIGGGSTFYDANGTAVAHCPVVAPDAMSEQCRTLLLGNNCLEQEVC